MSGKRTISAVSVDDVEKRRHPSKHYVYKIFVTWSDGQTSIIFRRYSKFFDLQVRLLDKFPDEGGRYDPTRRSIPFLPGKILFGRSHIRDVAERRKGPINDYCKKLTRLEPRISECEEVLDFFETKPADLMSLAKRESIHINNASKISGPRLLEQYVVIVDYEKEGSNEVSLTAGQIVEVAEKTKTGWWFINTDESQGWAPSSHLVPKDGRPESLVFHSSRLGEGEKFVVHREYNACSDDEISIPKGQIIEVLEQTLDGWWLVNYKGKQGRFPSTNLAKADTLRTQGLAERAPVSNVQVIGNISELSRISQRTEALPSSEKYLRPDWEKVVQKASPLPQSKKLPPPRSTLERNQQSAKPPRPPPPSPSKIPCYYVAVEDFDSSTVGGGISFSKGQTVKVLEKTGQGWWFVEIGGEEGWAPIAYMQQTTIKPTEPAKVQPSRPAAARAPSISRVNAAPLTSQSNRTDRQTRPSIPKSSETNSQLTKPTTSQILQNWKHKENSVPIGTNSTENLNNKQNRYISVCDYEGLEEKEVTFREGEIMTLIAEQEHGWWYVKFESGIEGYAPSSYFTPLTKQTENSNNQPLFKNRAVNKTVTGKPSISSKPVIPTKPQLPKKPLMNGQQPLNTQTSAPTKSTKISEMIKKFE